jgi:hypothetical protein
VPIKASAGTERLWHYVAIPGHSHCYCSPPRCRSSGKAAILLL